MTPATFLALLAAAAAAPAKPPPASVLLKSAAAATPSCRATRVDDRLVRAPLFSAESERCPVATVGDDTILLRDLAQALEANHFARPHGGAAAPKKASELDFTPALDRLITTRLLIQEARDMRLDADPKFRSALDDFKASRLRMMLQRDAVRGVKPDPAEVERLYRDAVREWKIKSILLDKEDAAKAFEAALKAGGSFDALAKRFVDEKKAKGGTSEFAPRKQMLPEVLAAVQAAKPGVPVGPVRDEGGFVMLRVDGTRYPPGDKEAREQARGQSIARKEREAIRAFYLSLVSRYAKVDEPLLKQLDLEAGGEKGFAALLEDKRPLATIQGEKPLTVGELTREVSMKFFHGLESPIKEHRVNREKSDTFERLLGARLFAKEAAARKLDARPDFRRDVEDYERGLVFDTFVGTVIAPEIKVTEQDAQGYYEKHKAEYTAPQMYKLDGLAFPTVREAQAAMSKLKAGTDFAWMQSSAPGQIVPEKRSLQFDGRTVSASMLPKGLAQALNGAKTGEYRLYAPSDAEAYVIRVVEQTPPSTQPYVEARERIAKSLWNERLVAGMNDYAAKLRKAQRVDVLITKVTL